MWAVVRRFCDRPFGSSDVRPSRTDRASVVAVKVVGSESSPTERDYRGRGVLREVSLGLRSVSPVVDGPIQPPRGETPSEGRYLTGSRSTHPRDPYEPSRVLSVPVHVSVPTRVSGPEGVVFRVDRLSETGTDSPTGGSMCP